jgi:hypothetical protein
LKYRSEYDTIIKNSTEEVAMLDKILKEKDYLPILKMNDGRKVTRESFRERRAEMLAKWGADFITSNILE